MGMQISSLISIISSAINSFSAESRAAGQVYLKDSKRGDLYLTFYHNDPTAYMCGRILSGYVTYDMIPLSNGLHALSVPQNNDLLCSNDTEEVSGAGTLDLINFSNYATGQQLQWDFSDSDNVKPYLFGVEQYLFRYLIEGSLCFGIGMSPDPNFLPASGNNATNFRAKYT